MGDGLLGEEAADRGKFVDFVGACKHGRRAIRGLGGGILRRDMLARGAIFMKYIFMSATRW